MKTIRTRNRVTRYTGPSGERTEVLGLPFGAHSGHVHSTSGFPDGVHIPGGRFVIDSPTYLLNEFVVPGSRQLRSVTLPDRTGTLLKRLDRTTDYSDIIETVQDDDGLFRFIGVSRQGYGTCKRDCEVNPCCPIGYEDYADADNYWPVLGEAVDIITQGYVSVYAESAFTHVDEIHVRVEVTDADAVPCQLIGGVTATADAGTQPIGSNVRIEATCAAGEALLVELGGMSPK